MIGAGRILQFTRAVSYSTEPSNILTGKGIRYYAGFPLSIFPSSGALDADCSAYQRLAHGGGRSDASVAKTPGS